MDPFCGQGTVLAMANALGIDSVGIELSPKRCRRANSLDLSSKLDLVSSALRTIHFKRLESRSAAAAALQVSMEDDCKQSSAEGVDDDDDDAQVGTP